MKRQSSKLFFTAALNQLVTAALNSASGLYQEIQLADGEREIRYRLSPYGVFPGVDIHGKQIMQVVDEEAGSTMAANFKSLSGQFATFFRGIPMYEGHADDPKWLEKNPGHKASAQGRIKAIENQTNGDDDDGVYVTAVLNSGGVELLSGEAPKYSGHSPLWRLAAIPGKPSHFRPVLLWSDALTNTPNILTNTIALNSLQGVGELPEESSPDADQPGETENHETTEIMLTPDALKALGFAADATPTPEEISAAIIKLCSAKETATAQKATAETATTAANSRITVLQTRLDTILGTAVETVVTDALNSGRITPAEKDAWTTALNSDFDAEAKKLLAKMPTVNTHNQIGKLGDRRPSMADAANASSAVTDGIREYAAEKGIDITTTAGWERATAGCRTAKPELFAKA